jgi:DNA-binding response OmpR family regulator
MKALFIDDDEFILELYERVFKLEQHEVLSAHDGNEALQLLEKTNPLPDVIILDILMPNMDGFQFLEHFHADPKINNIPVLILSNLYKREDRQKGLDLGAKMFLVKSEHDPREILARALELVEKTS